MKALYISISTFLLLFSSVPFMVSAETVLRANDSITLAVDQDVQGDFYGFSGFAGPVLLSGNIQEDAYVVGSSVTANGAVGGDLSSLGGVVQVHASVTDDVRIVGGEVTIAQYVGGDLFVMAGSLTVLSSAHIDGNVYFFGGQGEINGTVNGSVFGTNEKLRIDGPVRNGIDVVVTNTLVLGDRADIGGDVRYKSNGDIVRAQNAIVEGDVVKNSVQKTYDTNTKDALVPFLIYAFSVLSIFAIFRKHLSELMTGTFNSFSRTGMVGLVGVFCLPLAALLLVVTVIGSIIGFMGLCAVLLLSFAALLLVSVFIGFVFNRLVVKTEQVTLGGTLIGIVLTEILFLVPVVGSLIFLVIWIVLFGALLLRLYRFLA